MVFSISKPFRQPLYTNLWFTLSLVVLLGLNTFMVVSSDEWLGELMTLETDPSMTFRLSALVIVVINAAVSYFYERVIVWYVSIWHKNRSDRKIQRQQRLEIEEQQRVQKNYPLQNDTSEKRKGPAQVEESKVDGGNST
jgi:hypothetical protein